MGTIEDSVNLAKSVVSGYFILQKGVVGSCHAACHKLKTPINWSLLRLFKQYRYLLVKC